MAHQAQSIHANGFSKCVWDTFTACHFKWRTFIISEKRRNKLKKHSEIFRTIIWIIHHLWSLVLPERSPESQRLECRTERLSAHLSRFCRIPPLGISSPRIESQKRGSTEYWKLKGNHSLETAFSQYLTKSSFFFKIHKNLKASQRTLPP